MTQRWEILKDKANKEYKANNWDSAISLYSDAISNSY
jgi:hypothetical protein